MQPPNRSSHSLFVYGTLLSGEPNHHMLSSAEFVGQAETEPEFELVDWDEYPALVRGGQGVIKGELYKISDELLAIIDEFEEHPTLYCRVRIRLRGGKEAEAYVVDAERLASRPRIGSGDWRSHVQMRGA